MVELLAVSSAAWGVLMALSPILQVRRIVSRRSSADISVGSLAVLQVGFALWLAYGITIGNAVLVVPNAMALIIGFVTIGVTWWFRQASGP
jgi:uncharacterized protein with PQ loop repeat